MFSIGEFSKITGLTVKTLRFYHEQGVLDPSYIDGQTGYRYYADSKIETARVIALLRQLDFTLADITGILENNHDEADILDLLERQKQAIGNKLQEYRAISSSLDQIIIKEREAREVMKHATFEVEEKSVDSMLIAGVRMKGRYSDCAKGFAQIGRHFGRQICDKPFLLHYDTEYKETDADFEACMPIRKGTSKDEISVRVLPGGRCVALLHKGPYEELGQSYARILSYIQQKEFEIEIPSREVYIKGPGMIFKGNPKKYLTEIQMLIKE
ncbi:MerR family transcriptional regulator [uncultured Gimesia sp.]|uniref:MerR family transcriptional regulator n=1 Tax=uncultured Gimesia sp. TaxID=1678688 RepID=UPI00261E34CE|nr:MerR family transcriptional regulator [uncultured Gimesia sp.]